MPLDLFHPAVATWFEKRFGSPTEPQARAWPEIHAGRHTLIAAPTGSGKTLAAFLAAIDGLVRQALDGTLRDETQVVYVSPLKALSNDVQKNLEEPLAGIRAELIGRGLPDAEIRTLVRTGDTPAAERATRAADPAFLQNGAVYVLSRLVAGGWACWGSERSVPPPPDVSPPPRHEHGWTHH